MSRPHIISTTQWAAFQQTETGGSVTCQLVKQTIAAVDENRCFMKSIAKTAILCARQNISPRGHDESAGSMNKGNFREILDLIASENQDSLLARRLHDGPRNAKYISSDIQNELLKAASATVLEQICEKVQKAGKFAIMADEIQDINLVEQLSICVRFVDQEETPSKNVSLDLLTSMIWTQRR
jgi:uncharacterized protein YjgD (DUF1641 family)